MAAAFIPSLSDQRSFVYYSTTTLDEGEWIMVMQRPRESASGSGLLAPFEFWVWILILVSLLAVGPIIYALIILRNRLTGDGQQTPYSPGPLRLVRLRSADEAGQHPVAHCRWAAIRLKCNRAVKIAIGGR